MTWHDPGPGAGPAPLNEFCWMDLKTHDPSGAAAFFSSVLGWDFAVDEEDWRKAVMISAGRHRIGGVSDLAQPVYPRGPPPTSPATWRSTTWTPARLWRRRTGRRSSFRRSTRGIGGASPH
ncbi:VOC family protein [Streptomyces bacillaris]|uniref:hypothetical protein n=1 Tax=Streptomyces bacillaris TaxID=68179 RepID=UPI00296EC053